MLLQSPDGSKYLNLAKITFVDGEHPSRMALFEHLVNQDGDLLPSSYFGGILDKMKQLVTSMSSFRGLQIHILRYNDPGDQSSSSLLSRLTKRKNKVKEKKYEYYLPIISYVCDDITEFSAFESNTYLNINKFENAELEIIKDHVRLSGDNQILMDTHAFSFGFFKRYGFELSAIEFNHLLVEMNTGLREIRRLDIIHPIPEVKQRHQGNSSNPPMNYRIIGQSKYQTPISIDPFIPLFVVDTIQPLQFLAREGLILTDRPERYLNLQCINHSPNEFGLNLLQFYVSEPQILIEFINNLATLVGDTKILTSFFTLIDEIYSTVEPEAFIGMNFDNVIINDEHSLYQTISNQQTKYHLQAIFSHYLGHSMFNNDNPVSLQQTGMHLIDLSQLSYGERIMVEVMFRILKNHNYLSGMLVSDIFATAIFSTKAPTNPIKDIHVNTVTKDLCVVVPYFSEELMKQESNRYFILPGRVLLPTQMLEERKNTPHIFPKWIEDETVLYSNNQQITVIDNFTTPEILGTPVLREIEIQYMVTKAEEIDLAKVIDEEPDVLFDEYLSQYHIVSIISLMTQYKPYSQNFIEVNLHSPISLSSQLEQMVDKTYLKQATDGEYEVDSRGRNFYFNINQSFNNALSAVNKEEINDDLTILEVINTGIARLLATTDYQTKYQQYIEIAPHLVKLQQKLQDPVLSYHIIALFASVQYLMETGNEKEQINEYIRIVNTILEELIEDEDLTSQVLIKLEDEEETAQSLDEVIDEVNIILQEERQVPSQSSITDWIDELDLDQSYASDTSVENHQDLVHVDIPEGDPTAVSQPANLLGIQESGVSAENPESKNNYSLESAIDAIVSSPEISTLIDTVSNLSDGMEHAEFEPPNPDGIGPWYPTPGFLTILHDPLVDIISREVTPTMVFLAHVVRYYDLQMPMQLELLAKSLGWQSKIIYDLYTSGLVVLENNLITVDVQRLESYPLLASSRLKIKSSELISECHEILNQLSESTAVLRKQQIKLRIVAIFQMLELHEFSFVLHALLLGEDEKLQELVRMILLCIVNPTTELLPAVTKKLSKNAVFKQLHHLLENSQQKIVPSGRKPVASLQNLPKPSVLKNKNDRASYLNIEPPVASMTPEAENTTTTEISTNSPEFPIPKPNAPKKVSKELVPAVSRSVPPMPTIQTESISPGADDESDNILKRLIATIQGEGELDSKAIQTMVISSLEVISDGPAAVLQSFVAGVMQKFDLELPSLTTGELITLLSRIQRDYDCTLAGLFINFADIEVHWQEKDDEGRVILIEYYIQRIIKTLNAFCWDNRLTNEILSTLQRK